MPDFDRAEAVAFIDAMRLMIAGKPGFGWYESRLSALAAFVDGVARENERLNRFIDSIDARPQYESLGDRAGSPRRKP